MSLDDSMTSTVPDLLSVASQSIILPSARSSQFNSILPLSEPNYIATPPSADHFLEQKPFSFCLVINNSSCVENCTDYHFLNGQACTNKSFKNRSLLALNTHLFAITALRFCYHGLNIHSSLFELQFC